MGGPGRMLSRDEWLPIEPGAALAELRGEVALTPAPVEVDDGQDDGPGGESGEPAGEG